jgi:electron transfer flavoprotein beta subunit
MSIFVCVKHVPDSAAVIRLVNSQGIDENITFLLNPYDEHALTAAVQLKDRLGEVVALSVGPPGTDQTLRSALAMGADRAVWIEGDCPEDPRLTARALCSAIYAEGRPDLVLGGKEAIDNVGQQTLYHLAAALGMPVASQVVCLELGERQVEVSCEAGGGSCVVLRLALPCVLGTAKGLNSPRYPTFPDIVQARKKELRRLRWEELGVSPPRLGSISLVRLDPVVHQRQGRLLTGELPELAEQVARLIGPPIATANQEETT